MAERTLNEDGAMAKMRGFIFGFSITRSIALAAELGIADLLADGPRTPAELAGECGVREEIFLHRSCRNPVPPVGPQPIVMQVYSR